MKSFMKLHSSLLGGLAIFAAAAAEVAEKENELILQNDKVAISFNKKDLTLRQIRDRERNADFIQKTNGRLFTIALWDPKNPDKKIMNHPRFSTDFESSMAIDGSSAKEYRHTVSDGTHTLRPSFPRATHWVGRAQWENFLHPHALEADSYFIDNMQAVADAGRIRLLDTDTQLCPGIRLRLFDGHTLGQLAAYITTPERTYVFAGDVVPLAASLSPLWISAYDTFPVTSYNEKLRMLDEAAREQQALIFCHDAYTKCCTVRKINDFYKPDQILPL